MGLDYSVALIHPQQQLTVKPRPPPAISTTSPKPAIAMSAPAMTPTPNKYVSFVISNSYVVTIFILKRNSKKTFIVKTQLNG